MSISPRQYCRFTGLLIITAAIALPLPARSLTIPTIDNVSNTINVGGTSLDVPPPPGFVPVTADMQGIESAVEQAEASATSTNNKLEAFFVSQADADAARAGKLSAIGPRYVTVVSSNLLADKTVEPKDLADLKVVFANLSQSNKSKEIADNVNRGPQAEQAQVQGLRILPPVDLTDRSFLSPMVIHREIATADGQTTPEHFTGSTVTVLVKDKVISSNIYGTPDDLAWEQSLAADWVPTILAQNPTTDQPTLTEAQPQTESSSTRIGRGFGKAIGVIVGTTIGGWFMRKRQQGKADQPVEPVE
jgi:hypothetical protein